MNSELIFFLVDDDIDDQDFFIAALKEIDNNIKCIIANDGIEALSTLKNNPTTIPDFIFLDQNMPRMTGLNCLREIKKMDFLKDIPVVMYSTSDFENNNTAEARFLGVNNFFVKTFSFRELVNYLRNFAEKRNPKVSSA